MKSNAAKKNTGISKPIVREWLKVHQWKPGQTGNPSGRSKTLLTVVDELTGGGREAIECMIALMRGQTWPGFTKPPSYLVILEATKFLIEHRFGKAPQVIQNTETGERKDFLEVIYQELIHRNNGEAFNLKSQHTIDAEWSTASRGQDMATEQPIQDKVKGQDPEVQVEPTSDQSIGRLSGNGSHPTHNTEE